MAPHRSIHPFVTAYTLTGKPNSRHDSADGQGDGKLVNKFYGTDSTPCH